MSGSSSPRLIVIRQAPIELAQFLKFAGVVESGGEAKLAISNNEVQVNGAPETRKGRKLQAGDQVTFGTETLVVALPQ